MPSGNKFITRNCRKLAEKFYAVYVRASHLDLSVLMGLTFVERPPNPKRRAAHIGNLIPSGVLDKIQSDYLANEVKAGKPLSRALSERFPRMPSADKFELDSFLSSRDIGIPGLPDLDFVEREVYSFVSERYTSLQSLLETEGLGNLEAIIQEQHRTEKILKT